MSSDLIRDVCAHLEFLGYKVSENDENIFLAEPATGGEAKPSFTIYPRAEGVFFLAGFSVKKAASEDPCGFLRFVNSGNAFAYIARFAWDVDGSQFFVEACYPSIYDKQTFGTFITQWLNEIARFFSRDREFTEKYFGK